MTERLIRLPEVEHRVGVKKSAIYKWIKDGKFPAPRKLGTTCSVWPESAIDAWISQTTGAQ